MVGALAYWNLTHVQPSTLLVGHTEEVLRTTGRVLSALLDAETGQRGYLLTNQRTFLEPYERGIAQEQIEFSRLIQLMPENRLPQQDLKTLQKLIDAKTRELAATISLHDAGNSAAALTMVAEGTGKRLMDEIRRNLSNIEGAEQNLLADRIQTSRRNFLRSMLLTVLSMITALALVFLYLRAEVQERRTHEHLRRAAETSEARIRLAQSAARFGLHDYDVESGRLEWDAETRRLWGVEDDHPLDYEVFINGIHPDDRVVTQAAIDRALDPAGPGEFYVEYRVRSRSDGVERWVGASAKVVFENRRAVRIVGTAQEISVRKQAEELLQESDRQKNQFIATLSHELRNPLAPIRTAAHLLAYPSIKPADVATAGEIIVRQVGIMARLLDDLLDISRISRGVLALHIETAMLGALCDTAVEIVRPLIDSKGHRLTLELPETAILLQADPVRLTQVITNLLTNAAKYTPPGGEIRLGAELGPETLVIFVADNGMGMPPEALARIFDMFSRIESKGTDGAPGLGIGLALARNIVEMHGGRIEAGSAGLSRGSQFFVYLPRHQISNA